MRWRPTVTESSAGETNTRTVGQCTVCGKVYPIEKTATNEVRPIGTDGTCLCGNSNFTVPSEEAQTSGNDK